MKDVLKSALLRELDYLVRMSPVWTREVTAAKLVYDHTQNGEDFVKFIEAYYKSFYMKEKLIWINGLLAEL